MIAAKRSNQKERQLRKNNRRNRTAKTLANH
jgi:hypothetical protein